MIDNEKLISIAKEAAIEAGKIQLDFFGKAKEILFKSSEFDLVTNADKAAEEKILSIIKSNFPEHEFLAEESGLSGDSTSDYVWVIDPIDGTTNYAHNFPHFAVSIGLLYKGEPCIGVVYDAFKKEMFWAIKDKGAYLNNDKIQVTSVDSIRKALLATGFPGTNKAMIEENLKYFTKFIYEAQAVRRPGSAALDLCYVACGRLDGFWEMGLSPWDVAAGICIVRESGGKVSNFAVENYDFKVKNIIATNGLIHSAIDTTIQELKNSK